jgi:hypothetical protein
MSSNHQKRFYTPQFSEVSSISVRRLAWSMEKTMTQTMDLVIKFLPFFFDAEKVCPACRDRTKCKVCAFYLLATEEEKTAFLASM